MARSGAFIEASDGARIHYRVVGDGPPLLLSTASFCTLAHWTHQEEALGRHFRLATWDYRGHGGSEAPTEAARYSLTQVVSDLGAVHRAAFGDAPAHVGGLSIGGLVSIAYALEQPERVQSLLLCNTGPGFKKPEAAAAWSEMLHRAAEKMEHVGLAEYVKGRRAQAEILGLHPEAAPAQTALQGFLASDPGGLTRFARHVAAPVPNLIDALERVAAPTLVLVGELDPHFQRASHVLAARLPRARRSVVAGAGHVLNLDQPEAFARALIEFAGL